MDHDEKQQLTADEDADDSFDEDAAPPPPPEYTGPCGPWKWFMASPWKRKSFGIFLLFGVLTIIWLISWFAMAGAAQTYIMAAIACIIMSVYGYNQFRILLGFKQELDQMGENNTKFRKENKALRKEIGKLRRAEEKLCEVEGDISRSNERLQVSIEKFRQLDETLKNLGQQNVAGLKELQKKSEAVMDKIHEDLIRHEKDILHKVFDQLEYNDRSAGFTKEEFDEFWQLMPGEYNKRWKDTGKTFEELAGDDGILDQEEFTRMVDEFVRDVAIAKARKQ